MVRKKSDRYKNWKVLVFWILGAFCALLATMIAGNTKMDIGTTSEGFILSLTVSLVLFLIAGLLWISVSVAIKDLEER